MSKDSENVSAATTEDKEQSSKGNAKKSTEQATPNVRKPAKQKATGLKGWLSGLLIFLLVIGLCGATYFAWMQWQTWQQTQQARFAQIDDQAKQLQQLQTLVQEQSEQLTQQPREFKRSFEQVSAEQTSIKQDLSDYEQALGAVQSEFANFDMAQTTGWRLLEARSLAAQAGRKVWLENDVAGAIALLRLADSHLEALANPAQLGIRQALRADLERLEQIPVMNVDELAIELTALRQLVSDINWQPEQRRKAAYQRPTTDSWQANLSASWDSFLSNFIRIERREQPVEPMLSEDFVSVIEQRLLLALQQAQLAVLTRQQQALQSAIDEASSILSEFAPPNHRTVVHLQKRLQALSELSFDQALPETLESIEQLERAVRQQGLQEGS